jgi:hypothetical protein
MQRAEGVGRRSVRIVVELMVIVVGVLIALAADRWNEARSDRAEEAAYLDRFLEEIQEDSARAADYMEGRPSIIAGLDSLISFVDGVGPAGNLVQTMLSVSNELALPPVIAWSEIQASNSLHLITDPEVRAALTIYYGRRDRILLQWTRQDSRARDPLWDELYRTGLFDPKTEFGARTTLDLEAFRTWPGIRELLLALGAGHYFQRNNAESLQRAAGVVLQALRR